MTSEEKRTFKVIKDNAEVTLYIKNLSLSEREQAESVKLRKWNQAVKDGAIFAEKLNDVLKEQNIWDTDKEIQQTELQNELVESIRKLNRGGIKLKEARQLAIRIRQLRNELNLLNISRVEYIDATVQGQAQNAEFNYEVYCRTVYNDNRNKKYFDSYEDFLNRRSDLDAYICSTKCAEIVYGSQDMSAWPENNFLKKYKFVDNDLRLINEDGHLVDIHGKLINEDGNYVAIVDDKEIVVDEQGNPLEEISLTPAPFLTDDGEPVVLDEQPVTTE